MDTIAAISTPLGHGGIGIVRISGPKSIEIAQNIFRSNKAKYEPNTIVFGKIYDKDIFIDDALVSYFKAPNSYTGEDVIEINSHGGMLVVQRILELVLSFGARLAEPGEFTKRAFLNGKVDLSQAEAVMDLINSKTKSENEVSAKQLDGVLGDKIRAIKAKVLDIIVDIEANVDYPEYDIEEISKNKAVSRLSEVLSDLKSLSKSFDEGKIIKNGINVAIIGRPNAGKSSLLNRFLNEERAIVTDIAGTTRDTIEESIVHNGVLINFIDTAGIRETHDKVEEIGVEKSKNAILNSDIVLVVIDNSLGFNKDDIDLIKLTNDKKRFIIINKVDLNVDIDPTLLKYCENSDIIKVSAKENQGIDEVLDKIINMFITNDDINNDDIILTNKRQKGAVDKTILSFENAIKDASNDMPLDMVSINIQNGLRYLGEILGDSISEDVINGIFAKFCLGKWCFTWNIYTLYLKI